MLERAVSWKILEQVYLQAVTRDTYLNLCDSVCDMGRVRRPKVGTKDKPPHRGSEGRER